MIDFLYHFYLLFLISLFYLYSFLKFNLQSSLSKIMSSIVSIFLFPIQTITKYHFQILSSSLALDSLLVSTWKGLYTVHLACIYLKLFLFFILIFLLVAVIIGHLHFFLMKESSENHPTLEKAIQIYLESTSNHTVNL